MIEKLELIYNGNEKKIFSTPVADQVIIRFKDTMVAFDNIKRARFENKGELSNRISAILLEKLNEAGIRTHFIERLNEKEQLCRKIEIVPLAFVIRNVVAGNIVKKIGLKEGKVLRTPVIELYYNNDAYADPMINSDLAVALGLAGTDDLKDMYDVVRKANAVMKEFFAKAGITLVDMKIEFGKAMNGEYIVSDEISPDTCRLWNAHNGKILDKDRFRHDLGDVVESYEEVLSMIQKVD